MDGIHRYPEDHAPALVVANPGTQEERIYLIRELLTFPSWAWFRSDVNLPRGTPAEVHLQIRCGAERSTIRVKYHGKVVRSGPGGFSIAFDHP